LVPPLLTIMVWLPIIMPYSALKELVTTWYSLIPSAPMVVELMEEAFRAYALFMTAPSRRKLFERMVAPLTLMTVPAAPAT
jgi:hypothetical protein